MKIKCKRKTLHCELEWKNLNIAEIPNTQFFFLQRGYFYRVHSITKAWKQFIPPPPCHISRESSSSVTYPSCGPIKIKRLLQFLESPRRWDYPSRSLFPVWQGGSTQAVSWGKAPSCSHVWVTDTSSQPCKTGRLRFARSNQHLPAKQLSRNSHSNTQTLQSASIRDFASWDRTECHPTGRDTGVPTGAGVSTQCKWRGKASPSPTAQHHPFAPPAVPTTLRVPQTQRWAVRPPLTVKPNLFASTSCLSEHITCFTAPKCCNKQRVRTSGGGQTARTDAS